MNTQNTIILKELKDRLQIKFSFISKVILFGSQSTGEAFEYSDYDILILIDYPIPWQKQREIVDEAYYIDLKYNILTDIKILSKPELNSLRGKQPFIQSALHKGIVA